MYVYSICVISWLLILSSSVAKQFTLGKEERLKSRKIIENLFNEGKRFIVSPFRVFYLPAPAAIQVGVAVSSKIFKKAVDRNRIKRLTREAFRLQKNPLAEKLKQNNKGLSVFIVYTAKDLPEFRIVSDKMKTIIGKLELVADGL
jgi:ribonuclease P protein component